MGFEAGEERRARDDAAANTWQRTGSYPLIEWGWTRADCERYLAERTGVARWPKSACWFCPFALCSRDGRRRAIDGFVREPHHAFAALTLERLAIALNERQGLAAGRRLADLLAGTAAAGVLADFERRLAAEPHALYEVRRVLRPRTDDPHRLGNASRHLKVLAAGDRRRLLAELQARAAAACLPIDVDDAVPRLWLRRRSAVLPCGEHFLTVAPAGAVAKSMPRFETWWRNLPSDRVPEAA